MERRLPPLVLLPLLLLPAPGSAQETLPAGAGGTGPGVALRAGGTTRQEHPEGLPFVSFNSYRDNNSRAFPDERRFFKARFQMPGMATADPEGQALAGRNGELAIVRYTAYIRDQRLEISYRDPLRFEPAPGLPLRFCIYLHNNAVAGRPGSVAEDTRVAVEGFRWSREQGRFLTELRQGTTVLRATISASNGDPRQVTDEVTLESLVPGRPYRLEAVPGSALLMNTDGSSSAPLPLAELLGGPGVLVGTPSPGERDRSGRFAPGPAYISWVYLDATVALGEPSVPPVEPR